VNYTVYFFYVIFVLLILGDKDLFFKLKVKIKNKPLPRPLPRAQLLELLETLDCNA